MNQQQVKSFEHFEERKKNGQLNLIIDDIEAATKQLNHLNAEHEELSCKLQNSQDKIKELTKEKESLENFEGSQEIQQPDENNFFAFFGSLETREVECTARIEGQKQLTGELNHNLNALKQKNAKFKKEYELVASQLEEEENALRESNDILKDLEIKLDEKIKENETVLQQCENLKEELDERNQHIQSKLEPKNDELRQIYQQKTEELKKLRSESNKLHGRMYKTEKFQHDALQNAKEKMSRDSLVSAWKVDRSLLKNQLQKLKASLYNVQKNLESSIKRENDLEQKYCDLLGDDHNFGNCEYARKCVLASINSSYEAPENNVPTIEFDYEQDYTQELQDKLAAIENSYRVFDEYRESILSSLNEELHGCSQFGYIKLLQEEYAELQSQLLKLT